MRVFGLIKSLAVCVLGLALSAPLAWSQVSSGSVSGTVRDQTGAVIPGAGVELTNTATNVTSRSTTNQVGLYVFPAVIPGPYRLTVASPGMQTFAGTLTVQVAQRAVVDATLEVGVTAVEIAVTDVTPQVTMDSPTLGTVLERTRIEQLPLNSRNVLTLLQTTPGMEGLRAHGLRQGSHEVVVDGAAMSDRLWGGTMRRLPGLDTIQEFKVETNVSSARYTRPTTVVMSTRGGTNQLHGSAFHTLRNNAIGMARRRQDVYDKPPQYIRNEFGASSGGPVVLPGMYDGRDRTFWFFAYEASREVSSSTMSGRVPTAAMRQGDFRGLVDLQGRQYRIYDPWSTDPVTWERQQFSHQGQLNVIDPSLISPVGKYLFDVTPMPTHPQENPLVAANWWGVNPFSRMQWTISTRFDHRFSDNDTVYVRYSQGDFDQFSGGEWGTPMLDLAGNSVTRESPNKTLAASWVRTFSPTFFNELLVSGTREVWFKSTGEYGRAYNDELGLPNPINFPGWPSITALGLSGYNFNSDNLQASHMTYVIVDNNATKIHGRHEFQFGFRHRYDQLNLLPDQQQPQGGHNFSTLATALYDPTTSRTAPSATPFTGYNLANVFIGSMNYSNQFVRGFFYGRGREYAAYFQDNFKVTPRLTLNLGLRWEFWPAWNEKNRMLTGFDPGSKSVVLGQTLDEMYRLGTSVPSIVNRWESLGVNFITWDQAGLPQKLRNDNWRNFGPRLGFAYRMGESSRAMVMRGGYRISYFHIPARPWTARMRSNVPLNARFQNSLTAAEFAPDGIRNYGMRSVPTIIAGVNSRDAVTLDAATGLNRGGAGASYFAPNQPDGRVQDWNFTLEKEIMANTVVKTSYVGNHSDRLEQFHQYNLPTPEYIWYVTTGERLPTGEFAAVARRAFDQTVYGNIEEYRMTGWGNRHGFQVEMERRYSKGLGFQVFYTMGNNLAAGGREWSGTSVIPELNQFLPGLVPTDLDERNRFLNYQRDTSVPKHRVRWNWIADLPFGQGKPIAGNAGGFLNRVIGGWQIAGMGSLGSNYFSLPTGIYPTGNPIEVYGKDYPIMDCRPAVCRPGYLWWNGYIPANLINSYDANGNPNGIMGVPDNYRPAGEPLIPWPAQPIPGDPLAAWYGTNTTWVTLNDGSVQRLGYNPGLHPWQQQYFPNVWTWGMDASLFKNIPINERFNVRLNADFFNVLNRPGTPTGVGADGVKSMHTSQQAARQLQLTLRLSW